MSIKTSLPFFLPKALPCAPGKSPFRVKGSAYAQLRKAQLTGVRHGYQEILGAVEDPAVREFLGQRFLDSEWYDYLPTLQLVRAVVALFPGQSPEVTVERTAQRHADVDVRGIYKVLLSFTAPETVMRRVSAIQRTYFDFGCPRVSHVDDHTTETVITGLPEIASSFYQHYATSYIHRLISIAGAKQASADWELPVPDGDRQGFPTVSLRVRTSWQR